MNPNEACPHTGVYCPHHPVACGDCYYNQPQPNLREMAKLAWTEVVDRDQHSATASSTRTCPPFTLQTSRGAAENISDWFMSCSIAYVDFQAIIDAIRAAFNNQQTLETSIGCAACPAPGHSIHPKLTDDSFAFSSNQLAPGQSIYYSTGHLSVGLSCARRSLAHRQNLPLTSLPCGRSNFSISFR